jgi:hypothetical protein
MYFVLKQVQENGRTYDNNVRMGGFRTYKGAQNACKKHAPALIKDEARRVIAASLNGQQIVSIN